MSWYKMRAIGPKTAEIIIDGEIGLEVTSKQFNKDLRALGRRKEIGSLLNTPGGSVTHGFSIYNGLLKNSAKIHMEVDTLAASMGSLILQAADTRSMSMFSEIMFHDASSFMIGDFKAKELRQQADSLDNTRDNLIREYMRAERLTYSESDFIGLLDSGDTWLNAEEALAVGFVDSIEGKASMNVSAFSGFKLNKYFVDVPKTIEQTFAKARKSNRKSVKKRAKPMGKKKYSDEQFDAGVKAALKTQKKAKRSDSKAKSDDSAKNAKAKVLKRLNKLLDHPNATNTKVVKMLAGSDMPIKEAMVYLDNVAVAKPKKGKKAKADAKATAKREEMIAEKAAAKAARKTASNLRRKGNAGNIVAGGEFDALSLDDQKAMDKAEAAAEKRGKAARKRMNKRNKRS